VFLGGNPIGGPMTGWMAATLGGRSPFIIGGIIATVCAAVCGIVLARRGVVPAANTNPSIEDDQSPAELHTPSPRSAKSGT
jgi:hypothetical protein